jgi:hypothetical protein
MATLTEPPQRGRSATPPRAPEPPAPRPPVDESRPPTSASRLLGGVYLLAPLFAALSAAFAIAAVVLAIVLNMGSGAAPAATGAARLIPANALLYLHVSTDPSRPAVRQAIARARRFPGAPALFAGVTSRLDAILSGSSTNTVDFATDVRPWLGREAAFAVLNTPGGSAGTLIVLDVRDRSRAQAFLAEQGAAPDGSYRKVGLLREPSGATLAFLDHYLVVGQATSVAAAVDVAAGRAPSLADSATYARAAAGEPAGRLLDFYAPVAGVRRALVTHQGLLGALGTLLDQPALSAATISLSPGADGFIVRVHSALDPKLVRAAAQPAQLTPSLAAALPAGSMMLLDVGSLRRAAPKLFAAAAKVGIAGRVATLLGRLGAALQAQGVSLNRLFSIFGAETALAIVPGLGGSGPAPVVVGRAPHPEAAGAELAGLEGPLTQAFAPPSGAAGLVPEVGAATIAGVTVSQLTLAPGFQLDWAVSRGLVVLSTSPGAVAGVISHHASLSHALAYRAAVRGLPSQATSLVFFDLGPLLRLGEQAGLIGSSAVAALLPDLEQIRVIGLASVRGESDTTTEIQLQTR